MRVLHLDASARRSRSHTRRLSSLFVKELRAACPGIEVIRRDLASAPPPHVTEDWIAAAFTPGEMRDAAMLDALRASDELVDELISSDLYILALPMYNFSAPSTFKAYVDQIVRVGRTFSFDPSDRLQPYRGLVGEKQMVLITSRGDAGYGPDGPNRASNFLEPYVESVFGFLGINRIRTVAVENDEFGGVSLAESLRRAEAELREMALGFAVNAVCASS